MYRVWYSTESFADYIINHTLLSQQNNIIKNKMYESDDTSVFINGKEIIEKKISDALGV